MAAPVEQHESVSGVIRTIPCRGHAFDEDLQCPCGTTWFEHQMSPRRCRIGAQRGKRASTTLPSHPIAEAD